IVVVSGCGIVPSSNTMSSPLARKTCFGECSYLGRHPCDPTGLRLRVPCSGLRPPQAGAPEHGEIAALHHGAPAGNLWRERPVQLLEMVTRHALVELVPDVIVNVIPEETVRLITPDRARPEQLSRLPRGIVVFGDEPHAVQERKNIPRNEPQLQ